MSRAHADSNRIELRVRPEEKAALARAAAENEDWYYFVVDEQQKKLLVRHEWSHVNLRRSSTGVKDFAIDEFLNSDSDQQAIRSLLEKLKSIS